MIRDARREPGLATLLLIVLTACSGGTPPATATNGDTTSNHEPPPDRGLRLQVIASGLDNPLYLTAPAGDPRLFIVEQPGRIRIFEDGRLLDTPFLDITSKVRSGGEQGLLSVAFHPRYADNGYFYVNYTDVTGDTRVERYRVSGDPDRADVASASLVLHVDQPYANHNGGLVAFGPDGRLYIGMGDGGSGGDPQGHGQNTQSLLGALLRIDVDGTQPYGVPSDNPFAGRFGGRGELWAWGLRNPWRFSWDRQTGLFYLADVGQNQWEEIHVVPADSAGVNYGWAIMEGTHCFGASSCDRSGLTLPVHEYDHGDGCSITGGYVYRGRALPHLSGHYFYSDYCDGWLRSFRYENGRAVDHREWSVGELGNVLSFGEDASGELYVLTSNGTVRRFVAE